MKGYKPFSRKYYAEEIVKSFSKFFIQHASYYGRIIHDTIEGKNHENEAWKFGGSARIICYDEDFEVTLYVKRKSKKEKRLLEEKNR